MMEKTIVFIDAHYLSLISKELGNGTHLKYDFNQFAITLAKSENLWVDSVYYYTAPPYQSPKPTKDETEKKARYDRFISHLKRIPNFNIREGRCQKIGGEYKQKGVDTLITIDLLNVANQRKDIRKIILVSSDTDFVPIIEEIKKMNMEIIIFYYTDRKRGSKFSMSNHILQVCNKRILLKLEHFEKSIRT